MHREPQEFSITLFEKIHIEAISICVLVSALIFVFPVNVKLENSRYPCPINGNQLLINQMLTVFFCF